MYHYLFSANCPCIQNDVFYLRWAPGVHSTCEGSDDNIDGLSYCNGVGVWVFVCVRGGRGGGLFFGLFQIKKYSVKLETQEQEIIY